MKFWPLKSHPGLLYSCARPGRSECGKHAQVPDDVLHKWVRDLPHGQVAIVSLLGKKGEGKHKGKNEWSYYSFYGRQSFQSWLQTHYGARAAQIIEHSTVDGEPVPLRVLADVCLSISRLLAEGRTVVVMDSGGVERSGQVCRHLLLQEAL